MDDRRLSDLAEEESGRELRRRGRGLDPETALAGTPEKGRRADVEAVDREPVGSEGPQARPAALNMFHGPVDDSFETVDRGRDIDLLGGRVARVRGDLVERATFYRV